MTRLMSLRREREPTSEVPHFRHNNAMFLARLLRRRRPDLQVTLFTRHGCHLCAEAWTVLREAQQRHGFQLEIADVDAKPEWVELYGDCVPVVLVNGKVRFRGAVNEVLLKRIVD